MRISQGIHSLCGQQPHSPRKCSWALIKTWVPREAEMFCLFVKPQLYFLGLLSGWVSSQCLSSVLPSEESWSHPLFPGQKSNRNHISDITLSTKVCLVKTMVFPVVTYGCESWAIKKAECQRIDAFELWCWRRLLRAPWTARRSNQSILKEISPEYSLEGLMLKLKLQYFGHLMRRADSLEKTLMLGKIEGRGEGMTGDEMVGWHH